MENREIKQPWSVIVMIGLIIASLVIPPFGIIFGGLNYKFHARKKQNLTLIAIGVVMTIMWIIHFSGMHSHHH